MHLHPSHRGRDPELTATVVAFVAILVLLLLVYAALGVWSR